MSNKVPINAMPGLLRIDRAAPLGRLVAQGRKTQLMTQEQFAAKIGISRKTLSDFERGTGNISLAMGLRATILAGITLTAAPRRPKSLNEVLSEQAREQEQRDALAQSRTSNRGDNGG